MVPEDYNFYNDKKLIEIIDRLVDVFQPEQIYLFGSKARGDFKSDSDYDLLVIVKDDTPSEKKRSRLAYQALRGTRVAVDVLVWTKEAFNSRLHLAPSLPATVKREGKLLYAA